MECDAHKNHGAPDTQDLWGARFELYYRCLPLAFCSMVYGVCAFTGFLVMPLSILSLSAYGYFRHNKNSLYVLIAIFIPSIIYLLFALGVTGQGFGLEFALTCSMLLFSFGMGHQFNQNKKETEQTQERVLLHLAENVRLKKDHNTELETRIRSRTIEIEKKREHLNSRLSN